MTDLVLSTNLVVPPSAGSFGQKQAEQWWAVRLQGLSRFGHVYEECAQRRPKMGSPWFWLIVRKRHCAKEASC